MRSHTWNDYFTERIENQISSTDRSSKFFNWNWFYVLMFFSNGSFDIKFSVSSLEFDWSINYVSFYKDLLDSIQWQKSFESFLHKLKIIAILEIKLFDLFFVNISKVSNFFHVQKHFQHITSWKIRSFQNNVINKT